MIIIVDANIETIIAEMEKAAKELKKLERFRSKGQELATIVKDISQPLNVMIMGEFKTGKSTFINAMLGQDIVAVAVTAATAVITKLCYGAKAELIVHFRDGKTKQMEMQDLHSLTAEGKQSQQKLHQSIDYVEIKLPQEILQTINVIDTPGLNVAIEKHLEATKRFVKRADAIIWLFDAQNAASATEMMAISELSPRLKPLAVVNKIDEIDEEEETLEELLKEVRAKLGDKVRDVIGVSAREALRAKLTNNQSLLKQSLWPQLENVLQTSIYNNQENYKLNFVLENLTDCLLDILIQCERHSDTDRLPQLAQRRVIAALSAIIKFIEPWCKLPENSQTITMQAFLGCIYYNGYGVRQDYIQAREWCEKAACRNHAFAQYWVGNIYRNRYVVIENSASTAQYWYKRAAEQGHAGANLYLHLLGATNTWILRSSGFEETKKFLELKKKELNGNEYDQLLTFIYSSLKEWIAHAKERGTLTFGYSAFLLSQIEILCLNRKYTQTIELLEDLCPSLLIQKESKLLKQALKCLMLASLRSGNIFRSAIFVATFLTKRHLLKTAVLAVLILGVFFNAQLKELLKPYYDSISARSSSSQAYFSSRSTTPNDQQLKAVSKSVTPNEQKSKSVSATPITRKEGCLAGIDLKTGIANARDILGKPLKIDTGSNGSVYIFKNGIELSVVNGRVVAITIDENVISTVRDVSVGDSADKVLAAYGDPTISTYDRYTLYEYFYEGEPGYILRFAINKESGLVDYIGVRLTQTETMQYNHKNAEYSAVLLTPKERNLAGVRLKSNIAEAKNVLGKPLKIDSGNGGHIYTFKKGIEVGVVGTTVVSITVDQNTISTARSIQVGDFANKVVSAYGNPTVTAYDRYDLYEYFYEGENPYILRFAIDKSTRLVDYIGVRLPQ